MRNGRNKTTLNGKERNSLVTLETGFNMINRNNNHIIIIILFSKNKHNTYMNYVLNLTCLFVVFKNC